MISCEPGLVLGHREKIRRGAFRFKRNAYRTSLLNVLLPIMLGAMERSTVRRLAHEANRLKIVRRFGAVLRIPCGASLHRVTLLT